MITANLYSKKRTFITKFTLLLSEINSENYRYKNEFKTVSII